MIIVKQYDSEMKFLKIRRIGKQISREERSNSALLHLNCSSYKERVKKGKLSIRARIGQFLLQDGDLGFGDAG